MKILLCVLGIALMLSGTLVLGSAFHHDDKAPPAPVVRPAPPPPMAPTQAPSFGTGLARPKRRPEKLLVRAAPDTADTAQRPSYPCTIVGSPVDEMGRCAPHPERSYPSPPTLETEAAAVAARKDYATRLQASLLKAGFNFHILASGERSERIVMAYVLMSRPMAYKIMHEMAFPIDAEQKGFQHITLCDDAQRPRRVWEYVRDQRYRPEFQSTDWVAIVVSD
jgi:hypothetical protein